MLNIIDSVDWEIYRHNAPGLHPRTALINLNSGQYNERMQGVEDLITYTEYSLNVHNELIFDLVKVLFKMLQVEDFHYPDYAVEIIYICGNYLKPEVKEPRNVEQQRRLKAVICEHLKVYLTTEHAEIDSESTEFLEYLKSLCKND